MSNVETVKAIYEAFGTGNIPAILDTLANDVDWERWTDNSAQLAGVPWLQNRQGKAGVMEFFGVAATIDISHFNVVRILDGGDRIAAEIEIRSKYFTDEEMHLWYFDEDGKVKGLRHYVDTAKHIQGYKG